MESEAPQPTICVQHCFCCLASLASSLHLYKWRQDTSTSVQCLWGSILVISGCQSKSTDWWLKQEKRPSYNFCSPEAWELQGRLSSWLLTATCWLCAYPWHTDSALCSKATSSIGSGSLTYVTFITFKSPTSKCCHILGSEFHIWIWGTQCNP